MTMSIPDTPAITSALPEAKNIDQLFRVDHIKGDLKRRTVRGGAVAFGSQLIRQALTVGSTAILARLLTPADTGLIAMVTVITGFVALFNDLGLSAATVQRAEIDHQQVSTLFWINVATGVVLALITAALAPAVAWFYDEPRLTVITLVMSTTFILGGLGVQHRALLKRQMRYTTIAIIDIVSTSAGITVGVLAGLAGYKYWALVLWPLATGPVDILGNWLACRWRPGRPRDTDDVRSMLSFGANLTGFSLVNYFARNLDNLLIGRIFGAGPLGLYARAYSLLLMPLQRINGPVASVAMPALSRLTDAPGRYRQAYQRIVSIVCAISMPLIALLISTSDWVVLVLLGPRWAEVATLFALLGISGLIEPISNTTGWLFVSQGRTREQLRWGMVGTTLTIAAIVSGLPWGPAGVATAYGVTGLCIRTPLLFWFVGRAGPVRTRDMYATVAPFASATVAVLLALFVLRRWLGAVNPLLGLAAAAITTAVVTLLTLAALPAGRRTLRDLRGIPALLAGRSKI
jgi:O-antigen/teichoic acid export membrane protein